VHYCSKDRTLHKRSRTKVQKNFSIALKNESGLGLLGKPL